MNADPARPFRFFSTQKLALTYRALNTEHNLVNNLDKNAHYTDSIFRRQSVDIWEVMEMINTEFEERYKESHP